MQLITKQDKIFFNSCSRYEHLIIRMIFWGLKVSFCSFYPVVFELLQAYGYTQLRAQMCFVELKVKRKGHDFHKHGCNLLWMEI